MYNTELLQSRNEMADFIKKLRSDSGLSGQQFGQLFGVTSQSINNWELGKSVPSPFHYSFMLEFRKKLDSIMIEQQQNENKSKQIDLKTLLIQVTAGVGIIAFIRWLLKED